ncbi:unnamed protein product [Lactuca saligna]|uniref:Uncharacterized protein n=1 Tax=Lactuca saligna TaxID=75948 RepID=A0AA36E5P1_LACSI|nr:unnamed protein product [Lactuca saligna]
MSTCLYRLSFTVFSANNVSIYVTLFPFYVTLPTKALILSNPSIKVGYATASHRLSFVYLSRASSFRPNQILITLVGPDNRPISRSQISFHQKVSASQIASTVPVVTKSVEVVNGTGSIPKRV